jgi:outer membrane lipoprotein SlyB
MREIQRYDEDSGPGAAGGVTTGNRDATRVKSTKSYEIIVRMADGSRRVIHDAKPASWRTGEQVIVIGGANPSKL